MPKPVTGFKNFQKKVGGKHKSPPLYHKPGKTTESHGIGEITHNGVTYILDGSFTYVGRLDHFQRASLSRLLDTLTGPIPYDARRASDS